MSLGGRAFSFSASDQAFELGLLFIRLFRALDSIAGGDEAVARRGSAMTTMHWRCADRTYRNSAGLVNVLAYLDARRALV